MRTKNNNKGFTLVEAAVAVCIFSMLTAAIAMVLTTGLKAYKRVKGFAGPQTGALIALEKIERDLNNTFIVDGIGFKGAQMSVSMAAADPGAAGPVSRVSYYLDEAAGKLYRQRQAYPGAVSGSETSGVSSEELATIKALNFSYASYDADNKTLSWKDSWAAGSSLPRGVKIEASFDSGGKTVKVKRIVFIPVSG